MNPTGGTDDLLVRARSVLLDALIALDAHRDSVVLVGAQAIYLHTGSAPVAVAEATTDSDLGIDLRTLGDDQISGRSAGAVGLEAAVIDNAVVTIHALAADDDRAVEARVASPTALLVAKLHKLGERQATPDRLVDKDAYDVCRLLVAIATDELAAALVGDPAVVTAACAALTGDLLVVAGRLT